jgi:hypothetical protein
VRSSGVSSAQRAIARGQRSRNRQPEGGSRASGMLPLIVFTAHTARRMLLVHRPFRPADRWFIRQILLKSRYIAAHTAKNNL